ncbi:MAG: hypothetical protein IJ520_04315 [Synergistaceae bacterium]|nr:hypothetical protein [Synergistaceae bacterium]
MKVRKVIALFVVVGTLAAAGAAFAGGNKQFKGCMCEGCEGQKFNQPRPPKHAPRYDDRRPPIPKPRMGSDKPLPPPNDHEKL